VSIVTRALVRERAALLLMLGVLAVDVVVLAPWKPHVEEGDEWRYVYYAQNLLAGFYSPRDRVFLWNGPGYPLLIAPFVKLGWLAGARYLNVVFQAAAMAYAWALLRPRLSLRSTLLGVGLLGLYPPLLAHVPLLYTETACYFLVTAFAYHALHMQAGRRHVVIAGAILGLLCLIKVVFAYVLVAFLAGSVAYWLLTRAAIFGQHALAALLGLALCGPYLAYTHDLTGRWFYWSSAGGNNFYWLATPYEGELGDWYHPGWFADHELLREHHEALFDHLAGLDVDPELSDSEQLFNLSTPESSDQLQKVAIENVRTHPGKFARNWLLNVCRLLIDLPFSVRRNSPWKSSTLSNVVLLGLTLAAATRLRPWRWPPRPWQALLGFAALSFAACSLSAATARFLVPIVPLWWLALCAWLAASSQRTEAGS
jgi:hypothetical protein